MSQLQASRFPLANPYAASKAKFTIPKPKRGYGKQWGATIDGQDHTITINHNRSTMPLSIYVDDNCVFKESALRGVFSDNYFLGDHTFSYNGHTILVSIKDTLFGSLYTLTIDGKLIARSDPLADWKASNDAMLAVFSYVFLIFGPLFFVLGSQLLLGPVRLDIAGIAMSILSFFDLSRRLFRKLKSNQRTVAYS